MKKKSLNKKLHLTKETIVRLNPQYMGEAKGGIISATCTLWGTCLCTITCMTMCPIHEDCTVQP